MPNIREQNLADIAQETKAATEKLRAVARESANASLEVSYNALVASLEDTVNRLPEYVFTSRFLPFFSGQQPLTSYPTLFTDWVAIAGAPNREVAIVDEENNELFRVPPLLSTDVIRLNSNNDFNEIFEQYELRNNQLPVVGQRFLAEAMTIKSKQMVTSNPNLTSREKSWLDIFTRYNVMPVTKSVETTGFNNPVDEDLEYE